MNKIYIDLGAYRGGTINAFRKRFSDFEIYAFECNPTLNNIDYGIDVTTIRKASWIYDGVLDFYISKEHPSTVQGATILKHKKTGNLDITHPVEVRCLDFSNWLLTNFMVEDYIVVKINIEGAEYDLLDKCFVDGSINFINEIYIEWHAEKVNVSIERQNKLEERLKEILILHFVEELK